MPLIGQRTIAQILPQYGRPRPKPKQKAPAKANGQPSGSGKPQVPKPKPIDYTRVWQAFGYDSRITGSEALAESCPWCGRDRCYLNIENGLYHCKHCPAQGNVTTFLTWQHKQFLEQTTDNDYHRLKEKRGIALQTLKRHELAFDKARNRWLIPFKDGKGNVVNIQFYHPGREKPNKFNLPELPTALYGFDRLSNADKSLPVLLCEGPFDAIALDYSIGPENRSKYVIVASPGAFKREWAEHLRSRKVRAFYDNDKGGEQHREQVRKLLGESRVAAELKLLIWPDGYEDCDVNDLIRRPEFANKSILGWLMDHCSKVTAQPKLIVHHGRRAATDDKPPDWVWPHHLRCGTYASFSGRQGTFKSTIALEIAARYSRGKPMPTMKSTGMPAGHVLYVYAEDDREAVENGFEWAGGDFEKWHAMPAQVRDGDPLNVLEHLGEITEVIRQHNIRLVIIDGQNSVVGAPNISTDMLARCNVTNKLHQFAQKQNVCLLGIRNEDAEGRALGPQSMGDIGRCVLRAEETEPKGNPPYCKLIFVKVSDTARINYPTISYSVKDLGGSRRKILWGESRPKVSLGIKPKVMSR